MNQSNATGQAPAARRREDPEAFDDDLEWLLVAGDAAMGERGTLAGTISVLEHGGQLSGIPNTDLYSDAQVGWDHKIIGLVERHRWLTGAWNALDRATQGTLSLCYQAPRSPYRSDELSGSRSGADSQLGRYAALAFHLTEKPADLLEACRLSNWSIPVTGVKGTEQRSKRSRLIAREFKRAREAAVDAHRRWREAKAASGRPRLRADRVAPLKPHKPGSDPT